MSDAREALEAIGCFLEWYCIERFEKHAVIYAPEGSVFSSNGKGVLTIDWYKPKEGRPMDKSIGSFFRSECPSYVFWNMVIITAQNQLTKEEA